MSKRGALSAGKGGAPLAKRPRTESLDDAAAAALPVADEASAAAPPPAREASDDAETPLAAFADIAPVLRALAASLPRAGGARALRVWDPYFCRGASARRLAALGFCAARNVDADFYASQGYARQPRALAAFDVVVTNPPFSGTHIARLLDWVARIPQPALLLLPAHAVSKRSFRDCAAALAAAGHPPAFFIGPRGAAYAFEAPPPLAHAREPGCFQCVWFCLLKGFTENALAAWHRAPAPAAALALDHPRSLPQLMLVPRLKAAAWRTPTSTDWMARTPVMAVVNCAYGFSAISSMPHSAHMTCEKSPKIMDAAVSCVDVVARKPSMEPSSTEPFQMVWLSVLEMRARPLSRPATAGVVM